MKGMHEAHRTRIKGKSRQVRAKKAGVCAAVILASMLVF
jgi:hypothetical protein